jgi:uncharacterized LabA/DUF88 family protein
MESPRVFLMVDGSNYYYAQLNMGWWIGPERLMKFAEQWGEVVSAYYYIITPIREETPLIKYKEHLAHVGYKVKAQQSVIRMEGNDLKEKENIDMHLALDAVSMADHFDILVLVSGDVHFSYLVDLLHARGKAVKIVASKANLGREMFQLCAGDCFYMEDHKEILQRSV